MPAHFYVPTPAVPDTQAVETGASPASAPADDPIPLTDRIRAVLDASNDNLDLTGASAAPETKPVREITSGVELPN